MDNQTNMNPLITIGGSCYAFVTTTAADQPFWWVIAVSIVVPIFIGIIVKGMDIVYREWLRRTGRKGNDE